jgi:hypothetical protein
VREREGEKKKKQERCREKIILEKKERGDLTLMRKREKTRKFE